MFLRKAVALSAAAALSAPFLPAATTETNTTARSTIPYVPTRHDTVRDMLWLADVGTNDVVYDLGSGDGRIVIAAARDFHAGKAVGVETNSHLVEESRLNAVQAGVSNRVKFIQGDLFTTDFSSASVVTLYVGHSPNLELRAPLFHALKPGARVVSHQFGMGDWPPDKSLEVRTPLLGMYSEMHNPFATNSDTPDYRVPFSRRSHDTVSAWIIPAPVAGVWRGKVRTMAGEGDLMLTLHQRLSGLSGSFELKGPTNVTGGLQADLWGTHVRLHLIPTNTSYYGQPLMWIDGYATNNVLTGSLWVVERERGPDRTARETRSEWSARRDPADLAGLWTWLGPRDSAVELKVERRNGRLTATYEDPRRDVPQYAKQGPIPVTDFYDFGGGFYFTLLLGQEGSSRRMGPDDGWLIGETVAINDSLSGTIAFHPYPKDAFFVTDLNSPTAKPDQDARKPLKSGRRPWEAKRVVTRVQ